MLFPSMALGIQAAGRPQDAGHAVAFYSFARVFGQAFGVAIGGVTFQNQIKKNLLSHELLKDHAVEWSRDATALINIIHEMSEGLEKTQLIKAYSDSLSTIWIVVCALSAVGLVASLFTKGYTLVQEHTTEQRLQDKEKVVDSERAVKNEDESMTPSLREMDRLAIHRSVTRG